MRLRALLSARPGLTALAFLALALTAAPHVAGGGAAAQAPDAKAKPAVEALPTGVVTAAMWKQAATTPLEPGEIDRLIAQELKKNQIEAAARTTDEQFLRRVTLDLTGKLPTPTELSDFLKSTDPNKRAKAIDRLLDSPDFARHLGRYWREVVASRVSDNLMRINAPEFERWLAEQFQANKPWDEMTRTMLTATGEMRFDGSSKNGAAYFLASRRGAESVTERAAETSRVFLGVQIQCAQCHDHPSDVWKRKQFHEFAAYFARLRDRPIFEEKRLLGFALVSTPFGEHALPDPSNPTPAKGKGFKGPANGLTPRFLDGKAATARATDEARRKALADAITNKDNPWFAAAFVNRMWGELMGQSFYMPIDDLGPQKEAVFPTVIARLAGAFRGMKYDIKALYRAVMNSETYQRQLRPGESPEEHVMFAGAFPTRLRAEALTQSLTGALGDLKGGLGAGKGFGGGKGFGKGFGGFGLEGQIRQEFEFDPSSRPEDVEGSVAQALLLMNNPVIAQKIKATGTNVLARILQTYSDDGEALRAVYQRALARRPTERELTRCREHIRTARSRAEAYEDILWALINSTEFQTRR